MTSYNTFINEANLSAVVRKINKEETSAIAIISPNRKEFGDEKNTTNNTTIKKILKDKEYGYVQLKGGWVENKGKENEVKVTENSFFIEVPTEKEEELFELCKHLSSKQVFDQDGFIFKSKNYKFGIYSKKGTLVHNFNKSSISLHNVEDLFSELKFGNHKGTKFIFEEVGLYEVSTLIGAYNRKEWLNN